MAVLVARLIYRYGVVHLPRAAVLFTRTVVLIAENNHECEVHLELARRCKYQHLIRDRRERPILLSTSSWDGPVAVRV